MARFIDPAPDHNGYKYAFVAVGIFSKICHAVPVKDKKPQESIRAMKEVFEEIGIPEVIYHDNEGSWSSTEFIRLIDSHKIKQIITSTPPPFAESMVKIIKNMIHTRLEGLEMDKEKWIDMLGSELKKYSNTKHSTTGVSPNEAVKPSNHFHVWLNIINKTKFNRKYKPLSVGQKVRTYVKPKNFLQGYESVWGKEIYTITFFKDGTYLLNDYQEKRVYRRHELLKIDGAEGKDF